MQFSTNRKKEKEGEQIYKKINRNDKLKII